MKKISVLIFLLLILLNVSADMYQLLDEYSITSQLLMFSKNLFNQELNDVLNKKEQTGNLILENYYPDVILSLQSKTGTELIMLRDLIDLLHEKAYSDSNLDESYKLIITQIKNNVPQISYYAELKKLYFKNIKDEEIFYTVKGEDSGTETNPVTDNYIKICAEVITQLEQIPVILTFDITNEVITKTIFLDYKNSDGNIRKFEKTIAVTSLYDKWPGFAHNPVKDEVFEIALINSIDSRLQHYMNKSLDFVNKHNFLLRDYAVSFGKITDNNTYPDANKNNILSAGTITLNLYFGNQRKNHAAVKNSADWLFLIAHGNHKTGMIWAEADESFGPFAFQHAQPIYPPPAAETMSMTGDLEMLVFFSCGVLDINDYNGLYPTEPAASPGKLWAMLEDVKLLGFNAAAYISHITSIKDIFLNNIEVIASPESYWLSAGHVSRQICAVLENRDYIYWHKSNIFGLPYEYYELKTVTREEWENYIPERKRKIFNKSDINKALEKIEENKNAETVLKSVSEIYETFSKQTIYKTEQAINLLKLDINSSRGKFIKAVTLMLERNALEKDEVLEGKIYEENIEKSIKIFTELIEKKSKYLIPSKFMLGIIYGRISPEKQLETYREIKKNHPEYSDYSLIGEALTKYNNGFFNEAEKILSTVKNRNLNKSITELKNKITEIKNERKSLHDEVYSLIQKAGVLNEN